jgi:DNA-binding NarL/FixJ family response regulator/class 3 adenylate cyclase
VIVAPAVTHEDDVDYMEGPLVTIMFTDRAGPAASAERHAHGPTGSVRRAHFALLRDAIAEYGGREVRSTGEGLMVVFVSAIAAVRCAVDMQRATSQAAGEPALRVGLAAGEPLVDGDDLYGAPVTVASRLCDAAATGQILAADVVRQLAGGHVAALMAPADTLRLRDVDERIATAEVRWREEEQLVEPTRVQVEITVVVADDERLLRTGFRVILDAEPDIRVVGEAADGRAALDVVRRRRPDVVLMDIRMPELDGLRAAEEIVADPHLQTAVLMLTTFDASAYVYDALRIGASGFLLKDTPADRLLDAVRVVAAGDALLAPSITRRLIEQFARAARPAPGTVPQALSELTTRELDVLRLVAAGMSNAEIAGELILGTNTVKTHVAHVLSKLGLRDRVQAVILAYETGLVERELRS